MNLPIIRLALRSLYGRARILLLIALPVMMIALAAIVKFSTSGEEVTTDAALVVVRTFGIGIVVPVVTLIATTTLINSEFDDGSIIYLLTKPVSRFSVVFSKAVVILASALLFAALPITIAALITVGTREDLWLGALLGSATASAAYAGIFTLLATLLNRSLVGCLVYWLVWEATLTSLVTPARWLSARAWGTSVLNAAGDFGAKVSPPAWYAAIAALVCLGVGVAAAGRRLATTTISDV